MLTIWRRNNFKHSSWCVSHASSPRENELHNDNCHTNHNRADTENSYPEKLPILSRNNFCGSKFTHTSQSVQVYKAKTKCAMNMMKIHKTIDFPIDFTMENY